MNTHMRYRIVIAVSIGVLSAVFCYVRLIQLDLLAADFTWAWRGARELLAGRNPYQDPTIGSGHPYPSDAPLYYPLPALLLALPFTPLPAELAGALFVGLSAGLLAWGLSRDGYARFGLFGSLPFINAILWPQWSLLIAAGIVLPGLLPVALAKPSIGLAAFVARPTWRAFVIICAILALSLWILPTWPRDWLHNVRQHGGSVPILFFPGPLVLLALLRWRDWRARLLVGMVIAPQLTYDLLPVWLVPRTLRQSLLLTACSWLAVLAWPLSPVIRTSWTNYWIYLPALGIVWWSSMSKRTSQLPLPVASQLHQ